MVVVPAREFFEPLYLSVDPLLVLFCPLSASVSAKTTPKLTGKKAASQKAPWAIHLHRLSVD